MNKTALKVIIVATLTLLLIWVRVFTIQSGYISEADNYIAQGTTKLAVVALGGAIETGTPLSSNAERAAQKLWQIAETLSSNGDDYGALRAYGTLRSSFYSTRWLMTPGSDWIKKCDAIIANLNVKILKDEGRLEDDAEAERFSSAAEHDISPTAGWSLLAILSFFGWLGAAYYTITRGFEDSGKLNQRALAIGVICLIVMMTICGAALFTA